MRLIDLVHDALKIASEDPEYLNAHVEVHGHDGSWAWVSRVSPLKLTDTDSGVTRAVVIGVMSEGVRQPTQPIGKPVNATVSNHEHPHQEEK